MKFLVQLMFAMLFAVASCNPLATSATNDTSALNKLLAGKIGDSRIGSTLVGNAVRNLAEKNNMHEDVFTDHVSNGNILVGRNGEVGLDVTITSHGGTTVQAVVTNTGTYYVPHAGKEYPQLTDDCSPCRKIFCPSVSF